MFISPAASPLATAKGSVKLRDVQEETQLALTDRSSLTKGVDYGVQSKNIWRLADLGAKHAFLRAGWGWGHMPMWLVADDIASGRLVQIELEGPAAGISSRRFTRPVRCQAQPAAG